MEFKDDCPCSDGCPMNTALQIIGGKWKIKILCVLNVNGPSRYNSIKKKVAGINATMLAESLRELEALGIVNRMQYETMPVSVEYSLTEAGQSIIPILAQLREWSAEHEASMADAASK